MNNIFEIKNLEVFEVSGVKRPANKKKFLLTKEECSYDREYKEPTMFYDEAKMLLISEGIKNLSFMLEDSITAILSDNSIDMKEQMLCDSIDQFAEAIVNLKFEKQEISKEARTFNTLFDLRSKGLDVVRYIDALRISLEEILLSTLPFQEKRDMFYETLNQFKKKVIDLVNAMPQMRDGMSSDNIHSDLDSSLNVFNVDLNDYNNDDFKGCCTVCGYGDPFQFKLSKCADNKCIFCRN